MIPHVSHLLCAELIRDGGSVAALFVDQRGNTQWLFFRVIRQINSAGLDERIGFATPRLIDRLSGAEMPMRWQSARILVARLLNAATGHQDRRWLEVMDEIAASEGEALPDCPELKSSFLYPPHLREHR